MVSKKRLPDRGTSRLELKYDPLERLCENTDTTGLQPVVPEL